MKKKFLSLMMAAAVVATTSVSAFADTIINNDGDTAEVTISGAVNGEGDKTPSGTLSVTVPTALSFAVKNDGTVQGSEIKIENNGAQAINVYAYEFADTTVSDKITVYNKGEENLLQKKSNVILNLQGNRETAYFKSEKITESNKGVFGEDGSRPGADGVLISNILNGRSGNLRLDGKAGQGGLDNPTDTKDGISDTFTLRLKIKKA